MGLLSMRPEMDHLKVSDLMKGETSPIITLFVITSRFFETMASSSSRSDATTTYSYGDAGEEHVYTCQGHPFTVLNSKILPTWEDSLIDYDFVRKVGLKLTSIQCRRVTFGGHTLRIMGRVKATVQCVQDGRSLGEVKIDAKATTDILHRFDTYMIAGRKMKKKLATHHVDDSNHSDRHCEECCVFRRLKEPLDFCGNDMCGLPRLGHKCVDPFHVYLDCDCEDPTHGDRHCQECCPYTY